MQRPSFRRTNTPRCTISVIVSFLIGGCGGESGQPSAPAPLSGQTKGWSEGERQRSDSQGPRIKSGNIKTH
jgi:hypothetical protein